MAVRAGNLRHRVTIQRKSVSLDGYGAENASWAEFARVWASVEGLAGRELWAAQAEQGEQTTGVRARWLPGVKVEDRVVFGSRTFDILAVVDATGRGREMELMCRELVE